jgi:hypothetical protein
LAWEGSIHAAEAVSASSQRADLVEVLEAAVSASPLTRIEYRDRIAAFGQPAIAAISPWLSDPQLGAFAVRVITAAGLGGPRKEAAAVLVSARPAVPPVIAGDIDEALGKLGIRATPPGEPKAKAPVEMNHSLRDHLVEVARAGKTMTYSDAAEILGFSMRNPHHRRLLGQHLGAISEFEVDHGRPMLSVVVVHKGEQHVGSGFLQLGEELGRKRAVEDDQSFEVRELFRVHDYGRLHAEK